MTDQTYDLLMRCEDEKKRAKKAEAERDDLKRRLDLALEGECSAVHQQMALDHNLKEVEAELERLNNGQAESQ